MSAKRSGLGRNLSALLKPTLSAEQGSSEPELLKLPLHALQPGKYQPRKLFDDESLQQLADSIKQQGLLQPIVVRELSRNSYEILAGERRWRACQLAELSDIPVIVQQVDDETAMAIALVENLQREDLNPMDQARAMARLTQEFNLTHQQIADLLSKSRTAVSNFLRLLSLSDEVMLFLENGDLDMGHARALLMLEKEPQIETAKLIIAKNLSVRETEKLVARLKQNRSPLKPRELACPPEIHSKIEAISQILNTKINLKNNKQGRGTLEIYYDSLQSLEAMIQQIAHKLTDTIA